MGSDLVLVTAAASEMGIALVRALLAREDCRVIAHDVRASKQFSQLAQEFGDRFLASREDLSDPDSHARFMKDIAAQGVPSAIVQLPPAPPKRERFTDVTWAGVAADLKVQLHSTLLLLQHLVPAMANLPRARIVFVLSSVVQGVPPSFLPGFTIVEHARLGLMRALVAEYAASSIRINAISPHVVQTPFPREVNEASLPATEATDGPEEPAPADVIGAILFLLSPATDYISGVTLPLGVGVAV